MPLLDHLIELRKRLIYALLGFFAVFFITFYFAKPIFSFMIQPATQDGYKVVVLDIFEFFFVTVKLARRVPVALVWGIAAVLEMTHIETGWMVIDEFAARFVYFYTGYVLAKHIFTVARGVQDNPRKGVAILLLWAIANGAMVWNGYSQLPVISLALGLIGAAAVIRLSALMSLYDAFKPLRYCGRNSIVIYLAFFLPMVATRTLLLKTGVIADVGTMSVVITAAGVIGSLALFWAARGTKAMFLFERPALFWLTAKPAPKAAALQPAE